MDYTPSLSDRCMVLSDRDDPCRNGGPLVEAPFYVVMTVVWGFWNSCFLEKTLHRKQSANPADGCFRILVGTSEFLGFRYLGIIQSYPSVSFPLSINTTLETLVYKRFSINVTDVL